jgi:hypothetical protein
MSGFQDLPAQGRARQQAAGTATSDSAAASPRQDCGETPRRWREEEKVVTAVSPAPTFR